jgi:hypothetical protein
MDSRAVRADAQQRDKLLDPLKPEARLSDARIGQGQPAILPARYCLQAARMHYYVHDLYSTL